VETFRILIKKPAEDWLRSYDKEIQRRFAIKIRKLKEYPESFGKPLRGVLHGFWELYFENRFRIIYTINHEQKIVEIVAIRHKDEF